MILLVGSQGQLGSEFKKLLKTDLPVFSFREISGPEGPTIEEEAAFRPALVINCAAYTNVDGAESEQQQAAEANTLLPKRLVESFTPHDTTIIHFCTDYVYDGNTTTEYTEMDTPSPTSVYGKTKLDGANIVLSYRSSYVIRTSGVFTLSNPASFVSKIIGAARKNGRVSVVNDQMVCPTYAPLLAKASMDLLINGEFGLYNYCSSPVSWYDFACYALELAGIDVPVEPITTKEYLSRSGRVVAPRPAYSCLNTSKIKEVLSPELANSMCWRKHLEAAFTGQGI